MIRGGLIGNKSRKGGEGKKKKKKKIAMRSHVYHVAKNSPTGLQATNVQIQIQRARLVYRARRTQHVTPFLRDLH
jgi:hypothetical protein